MTTIIDDYELRLDALRLEECQHAYAILEDLHGTMKKTMELEGSLENHQEDYRLVLEGLFGKDSEHIPNEITLESIESTMESIVQGMKNLVGRIQRRFDDFLVWFKKDSYGMLLKTQRLQKEAKALKKSPSVKSITVGGGSRLHWNGSLEPKDVIKGLSVTVPAISVTVDAVSKFIPDLFAHVRKAQNYAAKFKDKKDMSLAEKNTVEKEMVKIGDEGFDLINKFLNTIKSSTDKELSGGFTIKTTRQKDYHYVSKDKHGSLVKLDSIFPRVVNVDKMGRYKEKDDISIPSHSEIETMAKYAEKLVSDIRSSEKLIKEAYKKSTDRSIANQVIPRHQVRNSWVWAFGGPIGLIGTFIYRYFSNNINSLINASNFMLIYTHGYRIQLAQAIIRYCEKSLAAYKN